jgi:hypothetical protein
MYAPAPLVTTHSYPDLTLDFFHQRNAYTPKGMAGEPVRTLVQWVRDKVEKH